MVCTAHLASIAPYAKLFSRLADDVIEDLESFSALLLKWNAVQNLVSRETEKLLWERHIVDSLQILPLLRPQDQRILDLGSGGGLPAIPLAIALKSSDASFILVESTGKKAAFLRTAIRELGLNARVEARRTEGLDSRETGPIDVVTSRALASLNELCVLAAPFLGPESQAIFHKGREHLEELAETRLAWNVDVLLTNSVTDERGVLLQLSNLSRRNS